MTWPTDPRPAKALLKLKEQIDDAAPTRDRSSDGMIASSAHSAQNPTSDHEPRITDSSGVKVVTAIDITNDPARGVDCNRIVKTLIESADKRIKYVIWDKKIWNPDIDDEPELTRRYDGSNPHTKHFHLSLEAKQALYDSTQPWAIGALLPDGGPVNEPRLVLRKGSSGASVRMLQRILGIKVDGFFGDVTKEAVQAFQRQNGLVDDGIVGGYTWDALLKDTPAPSTKPFDVREIVELAAASPAARYVWPSRGMAPRGYTKGMACTFANALVRLRAGNPAVIEMAKANTKDTLRDALAVYSGQFMVMGSKNDTPGEDTLRHLFVLLYGLGMRESSGRYCEGRDRSASNTTSETAEAGLFQQSWDSRLGTSHVGTLLNEYQKDPGDGFLAIFKEGVQCSALDLENYGDGPGLAFQRLAKSKPAFAVEAAAVGLRNIRKHWGPINRGEVQLVTQVDALFRDVQEKVTWQPPLVS